MALSIVIPNYNHAHTLHTALESVFSQSYPPEEVIVIDDASTDNSVSLVQKWQQNNPQIKLLRNKKNLGPITAGNRGLLEAKSEFLVFLSADDFVLPGFFEKASTFLEKHPHLGLCCGKACHFNELTPHLLIPDRMPLGNIPQVFSREMLPKVFKKTTFFIHTNCTIYRRKCLLEFGGLNPKLKSYGDWFLNCQIALQHGVGYIPSHFGAFRLSETSYSNVIKSSEHQDEIFHTLMGEIENQGLKDVFKKSGLLSHGGIRLVLFLARHKRYRSYFPRAFIKKCHFHINKMLR